jgi:branched-chain amino acid aminotransferase
MTNISVWKIINNKPACEPIFFEDPVKSLDDVSKKIPQGAYTTFRTFHHNKVLHLNDHFKRLEETARLANSTVSIDNRVIQENLHRILEQQKEGDHRVRITLDLERDPGNIYISVENLKIPTQSAYNLGVPVITLKMKRENPKAKLTNFLKISENLKSQLNHGVNEALMVDDNGIILEGLSSNFFAIINGEIWTEDKKVLSGITRTIVLEEAAGMGIKVIFQGISTDQIRKCDEAFLTSTSRSVLPIHDIDNILIGNGNPGPLTKQLMDHYEKHIELEVETI